MSGELVFVHAGFGGRAVPYLEGWELQRRLHRRRADGEIPDTCLLLEHEPVYTAGKRTEPLDRPLTDPGIPVIDVDRGGKITWHGPGQLVGYPIVRLADPVDVIAYVRSIEEALIRACADIGVIGTRVQGRSGVWVTDSSAMSGRPAQSGPSVSAAHHAGLAAAGTGTLAADTGNPGAGTGTLAGAPSHPAAASPGTPAAADDGTPAAPGGGKPMLAGHDRKVAAIGIRVSQGVTMHGFALNCDCDLSWFDRIVPCGIRDAGVTSLSAEAGRPVTVAEMTSVVERHLAAVLGAGACRRVAGTQGLLSAGALSRATA